MPLSPRRPPLSRRGLLLFPLCTAAVAAQSVTFAPRVDFGLAQEHGIQMVCADFDHDGHLDLAVTEEGYNQGKLEILYGDGQADFGTTNEYTDYCAWGLCRGDFDLDGFADLAVTSYGWSQHGVRIWRNDQTGAFVNSGGMSTLATPPCGVVSGDFDGDGLPDVAAISEAGGYAVDWFHGYGNGTFGTFHVVPNTSGLTGRRVYAGDFNGDGHLDLVAIHSMGAMVLLNDPQGTGNFNSSNGISAYEPMQSGAVADLDGDGVLDIVTAGSNLAVWHGLGNGHFTLLQSQPIAVGPFDTQLGDLDMDGLPDAVVTGYGGAQLLFGHADGTFGPPVAIATGAYPKASAIGDWNGDGWNDLAILCQNLAGQSSFVAIHVQTPPQVTGTATVYGTGCGNPALGLAAVPTARPRLGQTARATVTNTPSTIVDITIGWSDQSFAGLPLPLSLAGYGMPGCNLWHSGDVFGLPTTAATASTRTYQFAVPNAPMLLGLDLFLQAYAYAPGQNALQMTASNGLAWTIGNL